MAFDLARLDFGSITLHGQGNPQVFQGGDTARAWNGLRNLEQNVRRSIRHVARLSSGRGEKFDGELEHFEGCVQDPKFWAVLWLEAVDTKSSLTLLTRGPELVSFYDKYILPLLVALSKFPQCRTMVMTTFTKTVVTSNKTYLQRSHVILT